MAAAVVHGWANNWQDGGTSFNLLAIALMVAIAGAVTVRVMTWWQPLRDDRVSNFEGVKLHRSGTAFVSGKPFFDVAILNPYYVAALLEANPRIHLRYDEARLRRALRKGNQHIENN